MAAGLGYGGNEKSPDIIAQLSALRIIELDQITVTVDFLEYTHNVTT